MNDKSLSTSADVTLPPRTEQSENGDLPTLPPSSAASVQTLRPHAPNNEAGIVPGYEILGELGRGGMGVVYKARQVGLNRIVALKMILNSAFAGEAERQRFVIEAQAVALLQHANVVQLFESGQHDGLPYFTLEFVAGGSLADKVKDGPMQPRAAARLVEQLARGMAYAHGKGVIHRDLKPANVLLSADGVPKITDFGLAKRVEGGAGLTQSGAIMGTPSYMAPEQAGGKGKEVGPAGDIYALGVILYECLTGRPPFQAASALDTVLEVLERDPPPPRLLSPKMEADLETICLKCLEKDPRRRYPSAAALADDLARYLDGEAISARSYNLLDRVTRALEHSGLNADFQAWGNLLLWFAAIIFFTHVLTHGLLSVRSPLSWLTAAQGLQYALFALAWWMCGPRRLQPASAPERRLWAICAGFVMSCGLIALIGNCMFTQEELYQNRFFPFIAVVSGLYMSVMGSCFWGRCYAFAAAFFGLSLVMVADLRWAVLEFGTLWSATLILIGLHLRRLGRER